MAKITSVLSSKPVNRLIQHRFLSHFATKANDNVDDKIQAWQIHAYGGIDELKLSSTKVPPLLKPSDVLIQVDASSVNPIDVAMTGKFNRGIFLFVKY